MTEPVIAFGVLCAKEAAPSVRQLVISLGQEYPVFVHHDHRKSPRFAINQPNVEFVPDPTETGWGTWGFVQAIIKTMRHALEQSPFEYFQILSGSCLPIKPIGEFVRHVANRSHDVHMGLVSLDDSRDVLMSHGYRILARDNSFRYRVLSRARKWYLSGGSVTSQKSGLGIIHIPATASDSLSMRGRFATYITELARRGLLFDHPFDAQIKPHIGSTWFGCSREVCEYLVNRSQDEALEQYFRQTKLVDESYFHTLIGNSHFRVGPSNHFINDFVDSHPRWIEGNDVARLRQTPAFFARKFKLIQDDVARSAALELCAESAERPQPVSTRLV